jgi:DNA-binding transcriptional regulator LsrR (DeoR family)
MSDNDLDFELARRIHTVLVLHFIEGMTQGDIAKRLNLSTSKVHRLIAQGRKLGMIKIEIRAPFERLTNLEDRLIAATGLDQAVVAPSVSDNPDTNLQQVGRAAANLLLETIRPGDVIAITGGRAVSAVVDNLVTEEPIDVTVVPLTGGVQGKFYTDVNHLTTRLAERLGSRSMLVHAPLFAESRAQRDMLRKMASIREVFDLARNANVALTGVGSVEPRASSYYDLNPMVDAERHSLVQMGVAAEFMAHLILAGGGLADHEMNRRLVALDPSDISGCRKVIGVAAGAVKVRPIQAVLNGGFLDALVLDEETANSVLDTMGRQDNVA